MQFYKYIHFILISLIVSPVPFAHANDSVKVSTGMQGVSTDACQQAVKTVENEHFVGLPIRTHPIIAQKSPTQHSFSALTVVDYRGDDSHITITASPTSDTTCDVIYMETFAFPEPCAIAREELFKKWNFIGKMKETQVYTFRRDQNLFGYLTQQGAGEFCLVTKRKVYLKL